MSEKKGYDPFSDQNAGASSRADAEPVDQNDPMEELLSGVHPSVDASSQDDGWAPVVEEVWTPPRPIMSPESLLEDDADGVEPTNAIASTASGVYDTPMHHNPLPGAGSVPAAAPMGAQPMRRSPTDRPVEPAPDSNEAILGSGVRESERAPLPAKSDAPQPPTGDLREARPMAWILPAAVFFAGVGTGIYVLTSFNPILGGIAIALSSVGALFLRVLLRQ